jgi:PHD/YefM family antitoxin component YafN of YafNO toxin-antitoxin module
MSEQELHEAIVTLNAVRQEALACEKDEWNRKSLREAQLERLGKLEDLSHAIERAFPGRRCVYRDELGSYILA